MRRAKVMVTIIALLLTPAIPVFTAQVCSLTNHSTDEVIPGVTLTWGSSFHCLNAPDSGEYLIQVRVSNALGSVEPVRIEGLVLSHTTPRPRGRAPDATVSASRLPITVAPGQSQGFSVTGAYELVATDEGNKANLRLRAQGVGVNSGRFFQLGINVRIRGSGAGEGSESGPPSRPPPGAGRGR